ncbi:MAG: hypothetical protein IKA08_03255 [Alphaproteobacteria bacterium]|nr:hypothetical protein [Alphaproteobacteria bacterium]
MATGKLIAVEGADKAGKHTQVTKIVEYLKSKGICCQTLAFPMYTVNNYPTFFGQFIKDYLNGKFGPTRDLPAEYTMLPYALDRQSSMKWVKQWIKDDRWVIMDRYTYSNAFSIAKTPREQWDSKIDFLENLEFVNMGILRPDYNIYLSLDPRVAYDMRYTGMKEYQNGKPDIHESDLKLLTDVSDVYRHIASRDPKKWTIVDEMRPDGTRMSIDEVFAAIRPTIDGFIQKQR